MIKIIPAIDIFEGKCVRLTQGNYNKQRTYSNEPLAIAKEFEEAGFTNIHLVDLEGAKANHIVNIKVLESIAQNTNLKIDFGGGIKSKADLEIAFNAGAHQITAGSIAISNPELVYDWILEYGNKKIILGADVLNHRIVVNGWLKQTSIDINELLTKYTKKGIIYCICTDVSKDGMLQGVNTDLYEELKKNFVTIKLIASGGISSVNDIEQLIDKNVFGVIVGKAFYENRITMAELRKFL